MSKFHWHENCRHRMYLPFLTELDTLYILTDAAKWLIFHLISSQWLLIFAS